MASFMRGSGENMIVPYCFILAPLNMYGVAGYEHYIGNRSKLQKWRTEINLVTSVPEVKKILCACGQPVKISILKYDKKSLI